jgi:hypothetical protein
MQSFSMHKYLSVLLAFYAAAWAQIPARNCMSDPLMPGCPMAEEARTDCSSDYSLSGAMAQEMSAPLSWDDPG